MRKHSASPVIKKMQTFKMRYTFKIYNVSKKKKAHLTISDIDKWCSSPDWPGPLTTRRQ